MDLAVTHLSSAETLWANWNRRRTVRPFPSVNPTYPDPSYVRYLNIILMRVDWEETLIWKVTLRIGSLWKLQYTQFRFLLCGNLDNSSWSFLGQQSVSLNTSVLSKMFFKGLQSFYWYHVSAFQPSSLTCANTLLISLAGSANLKSIKLATSASGIGKICMGCIFSCLLLPSVSQDWICSKSGRKCFTAFPSRNQSLLKIENFYFHI